MPRAVRSHGRAPDPLLSRRDLCARHHRALDTKCNPARASPRARLSASSQLIGIPAAAHIVNFVVITAAASSMNCNLYLVSRMMFSLARGGYAPESWGRVSSRGTPVRALLVSAAGLGLALLTSLLYPASAFVYLFGVSLFGGLYAWLIIFVTHLVFRTSRYRRLLSRSFLFRRGRHRRHFADHLVGGRHAHHAASPGSPGWRFSRLPIGLLSACRPINLADACTQPERTLGGTHRPRIPHARYRSHPGNHGGRRLRESCPRDDWRLRQSRISGFLFHRLHSQNAARHRL